MSIIDVRPEQLARMAWREELDQEDTPVERAAWYALSDEDRAGLLAEQEYIHTRDWLRFWRDRGVRV